MYLPGTVVSTDAGLQSSPDGVPAEYEIDSGDSREPHRSGALRSRKSQNIK